jgi:hypothetical protein
VKNPCMIICEFGNFFFFIFLFPFTILWKFLFAQSNLIHRFEFDGIGCYIKFIENLSLRI